MISLQQCIDAWNYFFHSPEPYTTLGVFRIVWGALLLCNALLIWPVAIRYFGPAGVLTTARHQEVFGNSRFSCFHLLPNTDNAVRWMLAIHILSCVLVTVGWHTRVSVFVCWITMLSFHHRNPCVFHSGDTIQRLLTFLLIFAPAGEMYSMDRIANERDSRSTLEVGQVLGARSQLPPPSPEQQPESGSPWALRLMQIQICVVYFRAVYWKLRGKRWWDGTAAYYPPQLDGFNRFHLPKFCLNRFFIAFATYGTVVTELMLGTLIWIDEFRYPVLIAGLLLHLGIEVLMNLQLFGWTMIVTYLLFIPPADMAYFLALFSST